jgi:hypothetical protein
MVAPRYYQEPAEDPRTERERLMAELATLASVLQYAEQQSAAVGAILNRVSGRIKVIQERVDVLNQEWNPEFGKVASKSELD